MNVVSVMRELAAQQRTAFAGLNRPLRPLDFPPTGKIHPPTSWCFPTRVPVEVTKGRGKDRIDFDLWVAVGILSDSAAWELLAGYADGSGTSSMKAALEAGNGLYSSFNTLRVRDGVFGEVTVAEVDYLALTFPLEVYGGGA